MRGLILSLLFVPVTIFAHFGDVDKYTSSINKVAQAEFSDAKLKAEFIEFATLALQVKNPLDVAEEIEAEKAALEKWYRMPKDADVDTMREYYVLMLANMYSKSFRLVQVTDGHQVRFIRPNKHERMLRAFYYSIGPVHLIEDYLKQLDTKPILNNCDEICLSLKVFDLYVKEYRSTGN